MSDMGGEKLGGKFWLAVIGGAIACGVAAVVVLLLIGSAWYRWGFFGMFLVLSAVLLTIGWLVDRREKKRYGSAG
jgi:membrane protein implicated in regulation of membrane protease activity